MSTGVPGNLTAFILLPKVNAFRYGERLDLAVLASPCKFPWYLAGQEMLQMSGSPERLTGRQLKPKNERRRSGFMKHALKVWLLLFVCAFAVQQAPAQTKNIRVNYKETTLKNGLRVITVEDHSAPVIAVAVNYNVGSHGVYLAASPYTSYRERRCSVT